MPSYSIPHTPIPTSLPLILTVLGSLPNIHLCLDSSTPTGSSTTNATSISAPWIDAHSSGPGPFMMGANHTASLSAGSPDWPASAFAALTARGLLLLGPDLLLVVMGTVELVMRTVGFEFEGRGGAGGGGLGLGTDLPARWLGR